MSMDAHVRIWDVNSPGVSYDDAAARELAACLRQQPGFRSFTVLHTDQRELAAVAVFETAEQLARVAALLDQLVAPSAARSPERRRGDVLLESTAWGKPTLLASG
jgi:hypothetical protein